MTAPTMSQGPSRRPPLDVLVIGGGQAGLAMGYQLAQRGLRFEIVDAGAEIGDAWRSALGFPAVVYPGPVRQPARPAVPGCGRHLSRQGRRRGLPAGLRGTSLRAAGAGATPRSHRSRRTDDDYVAKAGAEASWRPGRSWSPPDPSRSRSSTPVANQLDSDVAQFHSVDYRRPESIPPGRVLVVGGRQLGLPDRRGVVGHPLRWSCRSANGSRPSPSGRWVATCGGGRPGWGWTG